MEAADPDIELTRLAQAGDARAFEALVVKYQRRIARHVARFIKSADDVEDVVQDVFVRAYRGLASFRGDSQFYSWLYRIASNAALNHLRRASDDVLLGDDAPDERISEFAPGVSDAAQPDRTLMAEQIADAVQRALAEMLQIPIGTVRTRIFRAREFIARRLEPVVGPRRDRRW